jgi:hypothetical protein
VLNGFLELLGRASRGRGVLLCDVGGIALGLALSGLGCSEKLRQRAVTHACAFSRH